MTKQNRSIEQLKMLWHLLDDDQKDDLINSDDITAVEVMRLDQAGALEWRLVVKF